MNNTLGWIAGWRRAELKISHVAKNDDAVKEEMRLSARETKDNYARSVYMGARIRKELA